MMKTLFVGLGGFGSKVVAQIAEQSKNLEDDCFVIMDKDVCDLQRIEERSGIPSVSLRLDHEPGYYLEMYKYLHIDRWLRLPVLSKGHSFTDCGAGMLRVIGRLAFFNAMENGTLDGWFRYSVASKLGDLTERTEIKVVIVTSLAGGTGSGIFIQTALWLREKFKECEMTARIYGFFVMPEVFLDAYPFLMNNRREVDSLEANAYASLRELQLISDIKTGVTKAPEESINIDDLFFSSRYQDGSPVYDQIFIYNVKDRNGSSGDGIETHISRIARTLRLRFSPDTLEALHIIDTSEGPWNTNKNGLYVSAMGSAAARYPKEEIIDYCTRRAAKELAESRWETHCAAEPKERCWYDKKIQQYFHELYEIVRTAVDRSEAFQKPYYDGDGKNGDLAEFVRKAMERIDRDTDRLETLLPQLCDSVCKELFLEDEDSYPREGTLYSLAVDISDDEGRHYVSPVDIRTLLGGLKEYITAEMKRWVDERVTFFEGTRLLPWDQRLTDSPDLEYPLLVLRQNNLQRIMFPKKFGSRYLAWFEAYCQKLIDARRKRAIDSVLHRIYPSILADIDLILEGMSSLDGQLSKAFSQEVDVKTSTTDEILLCASEKHKDALFSRVLPYQNMGEIYEAYYQSIFGRLWSMKKVKMEGKGLFCDGGVLRDLVSHVLFHIRGSILDASSAAIDLDVMDSLLFESDPQKRNIQQKPVCPQEAIGELCEKLYHIAHENAKYTCEEERMQNDPLVLHTTLTIFGVSGECGYFYPVKKCVGKMNRAKAIADSSISRSMLWCIKVAQGVMLDEIPALDGSAAGNYVEAYRRICNTAGNGEDPHIDPQLFALIQNM